MCFMQSGPVSNLCELEHTQHVYLPTYSSLPALHLLAAVLL